MLAARARGVPDEIEVVLHPTAIGALDDRWPRWTIASLRPAWVGPTTDGAGPRFTVVEGDVALGAALVRVLGEGVADEAAVGRDFTASGRTSDATLAKWNALGLADGEEVVDRLARPTRRRRAVLAGAGAQYIRKPPLTLSVAPVM